MTLAVPPSRECPAPRPVSAVWRLLFWAAILTLPLVAFAAIRAWHGMQAGRAAADVAEMAEVAFGLEDAARAQAGSQEYDVRWVGFHIDRSVYRGKLTTEVEPGSPDIYLKVLRARDGRTEAMFDGSSAAVEAWARQTRASEPLARFRLEWARGDRLRVELWEDDSFEDNLIDGFDLGGELSIVELAAPLVSASDNRVSLHVERAAPQVDGAASSGR